MDLPFFWNAKRNKVERSDAAIALQARFREVAQGAQELQDLIWALGSVDPDRGRPELRPFRTLLDAVIALAAETGLALAEELTNPIGLSIQGSYPLWIVSDQTEYHHCLLQLDDRNFLLGTFVMGVMPGAVDTDMSRGLDIPKMSPADLVEEVLIALDKRVEDVYPGDMAKGILQGLLHDPKGTEKECARYLPQ